MSNQKIICKKCGNSISIDDALTSQIEEKIKLDFTAEYNAKELKLEKRSAELKGIEISISEKQKSIDSLVAEKVADKIANEKVEIIRTSKLQAAKEKEAELKILEDQIKEKDQKISEVNAEALQLRLDRQRLETDKNEFELKIQRQLDGDRKKIEEDAGKKAVEAEQYKIAQLEKKISDANKANEELRRKLEQGSQQTQGEVLELELEELLRREFSSDEITGVRKGVNGADIIQKVNDKFGHFCGQIIWEAKYTKNWSDSHIQKLKDDQRDAKAELAVIVSKILPNDISGFAFRDGIWICDIKMAIALATALRTNLEAITREKAMAIGKDQKMDILYSYLTGVEFKQRVEAIVEAFSGMKNGLEKEKTAYQKIWAEREKQIQRVLNNTVGMYGDLNGIVTLPQISILELSESSTQEKID